MESIPDEILVQIAEKLPQCDLLTFTRTSRRLNRCTASLLYRFLVYPHYHVKDLSSLPGLSPALAWAAHSHRLTKIYKLQLLLRTIDSSNTLKLKILGVSFNTNWLGAEIISELARLIELLRPHLKVAHLRLRNVHGDLHSLARFVSLSFSMPDFMATAGINGSNSGWNSLLSLWDLIFRHPSVRSLSISDMESFSDVPERAGASSRTGTSNVASLSLPQYQVYNVNLKTLEEVLSWPAALNSFHISLTTGHLWLNTKQFIKALTCQRTSLKVLSIDFLNSSSSHSRVKEGLGLERLVALRTLGLPYHMLASCHPCLKRTWHMLPPSLEVLQLQYEHSHLKSPPSTPEWEFSVPVLAGSNFVRGMLELREHIKKECPRLREIVIWYPMSQASTQKFYPDELEQEGLITAFEKTGVAVNGWVQMDPPPFDNI